MLDLSVAIECSKLINCMIYWHIRTPLLGILTTWNSVVSEKIMLLCLVIFIWFLATQVPHKAYPDDEDSMQWGAGYYWVVRRSSLYKIETGIAAIMIREAIAA